MIYNWKEQLNQFDKILVLPEKGYRWNRYMTEEFARRRGNSRIVVWTADPALTGEWIQHIQEQDMQQILELYQLYLFSDKLIIGTLDALSGRTWWNLVESGCMTEKQVIDGMLGI